MIVPEPIDREDKYYSYLAGNTSIDLPMPITRKDKFLYYLCMNGSGSISKEQISEIIDEYFSEHPISPGATEEQALQIEKNKEDIFALLLEAELINDKDIAGVQVDYQNKTFKNLTTYIDFDGLKMYGGRRKCNVADDGTIVAWYGDENYAEDGSMGQVMVYQPAFYYKVVPLKYEPIKDGMGYHLRKASYYVSAKPKTGFRLHLLFTMQTVMRLTIISLVRMREVYGMQTVETAGQVLSS